MLGSDAFNCDRWSSTLLRFIAPPFSCSLAGVSRSVTLVVAYIMTITDFGWEDALSVVRAARSCANPNMGFQRQLQDFEKHDVDQVNEPTDKRAAKYNPKSQVSWLLIVWGLGGLSDPCFCFEGVASCHACSTREVQIELEGIGECWLGEEMKHDI